jgi:alkanesulfonate monooxygenase SsuD/methylene tetrahydromethanopterin reductase-like flavin-dependent oxidoreductase (luciferase family)
MAGMDDIRLGVLIPIGQAQWGPGADPRELIDFAVRAEELGYSSLWANDFLLTPRIEALTMLAAAAPVTRTVTLGTAALLPVLRRPVQAAQTIASIDLLSGGRLVLAVGAAFPGRFGVPQHELSEVPWERRFTRLDETVALWRQLWTRPDVRSFHGQVLRFDGLPPMTAPARPGGPPIWLGGASPSALRRAGRRYDGWLPYPPSPVAYADGLAAVRAAAAEAGRSGDDITPALFVSVVITDSVRQGREALEAFSQASYGLPLAELETIQALAAGPPEHVAARLREYAAAGARHFACRIATTSLATQREQLEQLIKLKPMLSALQRAGREYGRVMPRPDRSNALDHVVVIMFENRSFDNLLGRLYEPGEVASFEGVAGRDLSNPVPDWAAGAGPGPSPRLVPYGPGVQRSTVIEAP